MLLFLSEKSCIPGSFGTVTSLRMGFRSERVAVGLGPSGLMEFGRLTKISENLIKKIACTCESAVLPTGLKKEKEKKSGVKKEKAFHHTVSRFQLDIPPIPSQAGQAQSQQRNATVTDLACNPYVLQTGKEVAICKRQDVVHKELCVVFTLKELVDFLQF